MVFISPIVTYVYAFQIETKLMSVTWTDIENPNIPEEFQGVKIV
ncbi:hypothetical protein [Bacillus thuringiensis]|nr:hypothetical protein [Bacillus thuringiensis]